MNNQKYHMVLKSSILHDECYLNKNKITGGYQIENYEEDDMWQSEFTAAEIQIMDDKEKILESFNVVPVLERAKPKVIKKNYC